MGDERAGSTLRMGDYRRILRRYWVTVVLCLVLGTGAALTYLSWAPLQYRAQTSVLVTPTVTRTTNSTARAEAVNMDTEAQLVTATATVSAAADQLHLPPDRAGDLADRVDVTVPPNADILDISFTGKTAEEAQEGSRAFAEAYLARRQQSTQAAVDAGSKALQARIDALNAQLQDVLEAAAALPALSPELARSNDQATILNAQLATLATQQNRILAVNNSPGRIISEPTLPSAASGPGRLVTLLVGILLGLVAGVSVAALRHRADDRILDPEDMPRLTGVPVATVLSTPPLHRGEAGLRPLVSGDGRGYARLRTLVTTRLEKAERPVVLVAGVRGSGGPVAADLAVSLALAGERVYLICADVFGDTSTALLPDPAGPGLAEVLAGEVDVEHALRELDDVPNLRILGPGGDPHQADALLQTRGPRKLIDRLLETTAYVVIEAPPTTDGPDAQTLGNVAGLAVLVVEVGRTTAREILDACAQFESIGTPVLGGVLVHHDLDSRPRTRRQETAAEDPFAADRDAALATSTINGDTSPVKAPPRSAHGTLDTAQVPTP